MKCLLATLGKDAPGVNSVLRAATRVGLSRGLEIFGARRGFPGIIDRQFWKLKGSDVAFILGKGGSLIGSTDYRLPQPSINALNAIAQSLRRFDLVVATGGLGSFSILDRVYSLVDMGLTTTLFVPASVENEFLSPGRSSGDDEHVHAEAIGADSAANTAIEAIDRLREQSYLSRTVFIIQAVGAKSNFLPLQLGTACGAHRVYLPQYPLLSPGVKEEIRQLYGKSFDPNHVDTRELVDWINEMFDQTQRTYLVVILPNGIPLYEVESESGNGGPPPRENYERIVSSIAPLEFTVFRVVNDLTTRFADSDIHICYLVLDDLQRGGDPTIRDRMLGTLYGQAAIEEFLSIFNSQDTAKRGNLNLLAADGTNTVSWRCYPREKVIPLFQGVDARAGGLDPLPFFKENRGIVSGYRPLAAI